MVLPPAHTPEHQDGRQQQHYQESNLKQDGRHDGKLEQGSQWH